LFLSILVLIPGLLSIKFIVRIITNTAIVTFEIIIKEEN